MIARTLKLAAGFLALYAIAGMFRTVRRPDTEVPDEVHRASEDSFPASDPSSWTMGEPDPKPQ